MKIIHRNKYITCYMYTTYRTLSRVFHSTVCNVSSLFRLTSYCTYTSTVMAVLPSVPPGTLYIRYSTVFPSSYSTVHIIMFFIHSLFSCTKVCCWFIRYQVQKVLYVPPLSCKRTTQRKNELNSTFQQYSTVVFCTVQYVHYETTKLLHCTRAYRYMQ